MRSMEILTSSMLSIRLTATSGLAQLPITLQLGHSDNKTSMNKMIQPEPLDNKAIALRPITEREKHRFNCQCQMCCKYQDQKLLVLMKEQENEFRQHLEVKAEQIFAPTHMETVLKLLMLPGNKIVKRGVEVYIPQMCFFQDGEVTNFFYTKDISDFHLIRLKRDKVTQTVMMKIFNQRRRKYRDSIFQVLQISREASKKQSSNVKFRKMSISKTSKTDEFNYFIIRYTDGCQSMVTQLQFLTILQKRRQDPFWKRIHCIKNYYHPYYSQTETNNSFDIHYIHEKPMFRALQERANQLMMNYGQRQLPTSPLFISDEQQQQFTETLKHQSLQAFVHYVFYRIVAFIAVFADEQIYSANVKMMVNQLGNCYLIDVTALKMQALVKYSWTNQIYNQMVQKKQYQKYHRKKLKNNEQTMAKSAAIEEFMGSQYEMLKKRYGVTVEPKEDKNQKLNNQFFSFMYPSLKEELSELIKINIPVQTFRRKFLGQKEERKPLFKPFNSKFVRELHRLTPGPRKTRGFSSTGVSIDSDQRGKTISNFWKTISN